MFLRLPFAAAAVARVDERRGEWMEREREQSHLRLPTTVTPTEREGGTWALDGMEWVLAPSIDRLNYIAPVDGPVASTPWLVTLLKLGLGGG